MASKFEKRLDMALRKIISEDNDIGEVGSSSYLGGAKFPNPTREAGKLHGSGSEPKEPSGGDITDVVDGDTTGDVLNKDDTGVMDTKKPKEATGESGKVC